MRSIYTRKPSQSKNSRTTLSWYLSDLCTKTSRGLVGHSYLNDVHTCSYVTFRVMHEIRRAPVSAPLHYGTRVYDMVENINETRRTAFNFFKLVNPLQNVFVLNTNSIVYNSVKNTTGTHSRRCLTCLEENHRVTRNRFSGCLVFMSLVC